MRTKYKTHASGAPLLATRLDSNSGKSLDCKSFALMPLIAAGAFFLGAWWIRSALDLM